MQTLQQPQREFYVPPSTQVIFVQDFFASELIGGAELTSDAIIQACPYRLFQMHSHSVTESIVLKNKEKVWVFGNQVGVAPWLLDLYRQHNIEYYFFEYDFKACTYRSTKKHELATGRCDCHLLPHGKFMSEWMVGATKLFWCSDGQRDKFYGLYPHLKGRTTDFTQSSTFYPDTVKRLGEIRKRRQSGEIAVQDHWIILNSDSWIKGRDASVQYCRDHSLKYKLVGGVSNDEFIMELASSKGMVFLPLDIDVGSRTLTECKLVGAEPVVNEFVLHAKEDWFNGRSAEDIEAYLLNGPDRFWRQVRSL